MTDYREMLALDNPALAKVDPLVRNLLVAKSVPALAHLDIPEYQRRADRWAAAIQSRLPAAERVFHETPWEWKNDVNFFRLGVVCGFVEHELGIEYIEAQREVKQIFYTNPSDLFVNGVMDTRHGTCGNMATLHVAFGWRLGWPVSLACVNSHLILRYDDGRAKWADKLGPQTDGRNIWYGFEVTVEADVKGTGSVYDIEIKQQVVAATYFSLNKQLGKDVCRYRITSPTEKTFLRVESKDYFEKLKAKKRATLTNSRRDGVWTALYTMTQSSG